MEQFLRCPCCGHVLNMHKPGGCYGENLACACPFDRDGVIDALDERARTSERVRTAIPAMVKG